MATGISCLSNSKQLMLAWISYSTDHGGELVHNTHGGEAQSNNPRSRYSQWIMGWLDWGLRPDNTNVLHVTDRRYAKLAAYQGNSKIWSIARRTNTSAPPRKRKAGPRESALSP